MEDAATLQGHCFICLFLNVFIGFLTQSTGRRFPNDNDVDLSLRLFGLFLGNHLLLPILLYRCLILLLRLLGRRVIRNAFHFIDSLLVHRSHVLPHTDIIEIVWTVEHLVCVVHNFSQVLILQTGLMERTATLQNINVPICGLNVFGAETAHLQIRLGLLLLLKVLILIRILIQIRIAVVSLVILLLLLWLRLDLWLRLVLLLFQPFLLFLLDLIVLLVVLVHLVRQQLIEVVQLYLLPAVDAEWDLVLAVPSEHISVI